MPDAPYSVFPEVRTRRLIILDEDDSPRIVGEVIGDTAELRVGLKKASPSGPHMLLYATASKGYPAGPQLGVQLWADGHAHAEITLVEDNGVWSAEIHGVSGPGQVRR